MSAICSVRRTEAPVGMRPAGEPLLALEMAAAKGEAGEMGERHEAEAVAADAAAEAEAADAAAEEEEVAAELVEEECCFQHC